MEHVARAPGLGWIAGLVDRPQRANYIAEPLDVKRRARRLAEVTRHHHIEGQRSIVNALRIMTVVSHQIVNVPAQRGLRRRRCADIARPQLRKQGVANDEWFGSGE
jgi:hypothetical protein